MINIAVYSLNVFRMNLLRVFVFFTQKKCIWLLMFDIGFSLLKLLSLLFGVSLFKNTYHNTLEGLLVNCFKAHFLSLSDKTASPYLIDLNASP